MINTQDLRIFIKSYFLILLYVHHVCMVIFRKQKRALSPLELALQVTLHYHRVLENGACCSFARVVYTPEPSLQLQCFRSLRSLDYQIKP